MKEKKTATVSLVSGMHFTATSDRGFKFDLDGAPNHGGQGKGASPMALLLLGLAGCTAMDVASILRKMRQELAEMTINVTGTRAESHPKVFTDIHVEYIFSGGKVDGKAIQKAIDLSVNHYCSASAMLKKTATLTTSYSIQ